MVTQNRQGLYKIDTVTALNYTITGIFNECFPLIKVKVFSRDPPYISSSHALTFVQIRDKNMGTNSDLQNYIIM